MKRGGIWLCLFVVALVAAVAGSWGYRSEERRVGKEC